MPDRGCYDIVNVISLESRRYTAVLNLHDDELCVVPDGWEFNIVDEWT